MTKRSIKRHIEAKVNEWLATIDNPELVDNIRRDMILSGGAICSMLIGEKVKDYDVYFATRTTALAVAKYYFG